MPLGWIVPWIAPYALTRTGLMFGAVFFIPGGLTIASWGLQIAWSLARNTGSFSWSVVQSLYRATMGPGGEGPVLPEEQVKKLVTAGSFYGWDAEQVKIIWRALKAEEIVLEAKGQARSSAENDDLAKIKAWNETLKTTNGEDNTVWDEPLQYLYKNERLDGAQYRWFYDRMNSTMKHVENMRQYAVRGRSNSVGEASTSSNNNANVDDTNNNNNDNSNNKNTAYKKNSPL